MFYPCLSIRLPCTTVNERHDELIEWTHAKINLLDCSAELVGGGGCRDQALVGGGGCDGFVRDHRNFVSNQHIDGHN
jgi:hypothetical protein